MNNNDLIQLNKMFGSNNKQYINDDMFARSMAPLQIAPPPMSSSSTQLTPFQSNFQSTFQPALTFETVNTMEKKLEQIKKNLRREKSLEQIQKSSGYKASVYTSGSMTMKQTKQIAQPIIFAQDDHKISYDMDPTSSTIQEEDEVEFNEQELELIQADVKKWLALEEEIQCLRRAVSQRKKEKTNLNDSIVKFMKYYKVPFLENDEGCQLVLTSSTKKMPLNKQFMQQMLLKKLGDSAKAKEIEETLLDRPTVEQTKLEYKKPKPKLKKK